MKCFFLLVSVTVMAAACNNTPKAVETTTLVKTDSTYVAKPELPVVKQVVATPTSTTEQKKVATKNTTTSNSTTTNSTGTSQNATTAPAKKGWSKTAKGAVIGGVIGAGTGAIINKKNRLAGGVIGGVLGGGAGAVIGNQMDKKDGRH